MGTTEIIVVFAALMALIALVSLGVDWIGKPLKHRRFIPRMYRFEDEKLPIDAYGNVSFDATPAPMLPPPMAYVQPPPVVVAHVGGVAPAPGSDRSTRADGAADLDDAMANGQATMPVPLSELPDAGSSRSAFSDSLAAEPPAATTPAARTAPATTRQDASRDAWELGMALDATINDAKPDLATKAERFWMSVASSLSGSHFGADNVARMQSGKAPRRMNPRTTRHESMQLTGLRQASFANEVHMQWPDDSVDPWSAS